jgi:hypothetical protein
MPVSTHRLLCKIYWRPFWDVTKLWRDFAKFGDWRPWRMAWHHVISRSIVTPSHQWACRRPTHPLWGEGCPFLPALHDSRF